MLQIQLVFKFFDLSKPNDCENNFVDIFSPNTEIESRVKTFCGSIAETVSSRNNVLYVRFYADWEGRNSAFSALFTAYRESKRDSDNEGKKIETEEFKTKFTSAFLWSLAINYGQPLSGVFFSRKKFLVNLT
jgi:hypothetical protein